MTDRGLIENGKDDELTESTGIGAENITENLNAKKLHEITSAKNLAERIKNILEDKKGIDVRIMDITGKTIIADYFVIATGTSRPHIRALSDEVEIKLKEEEGTQLLRSEGQESGRWVLLDYGDVIVHVFHEEDRKFYDLEKLWENRKTWEEFSRTKM